MQHLTGMGEDSGDIREWEKPHQNVDKGIYFY